MTGKKSESVEEMKGEKEANHLRNLLCLFPSKLNIFGGGEEKVEALHTFSIIFPGSLNASLMERMCADARFCGIIIC
jgi:hypothetical protein